jgi:acetyl-CoA carboxylase carboxyltransferase component
MSFDPLLKELAARRRAALKMGSEKRLAERAAAGILNARQRIEYLLDAGSFRELGLLATAIRPEVRDKCPADGKISGIGRIADRPVALVSNDFTSLGASSSVVNGKKIRHAKELATRHGMPLILLGESSGARLPDRMGAQGRATMGSDPAEYLRDRTTPWVSALLGSCYGSSTWYACLSDIVVMRKGATMAVASGRVTKVAVGQPVEAEELGGWRMHATTTGLVDLVVDNDEQALDAIKRLLSYLPSHNGEAPPTAEVPPGSDEAMADVLTVVPEQRTKVYDSREVVRRMLDLGSMLELKQRFGRSIATMLGRIGGRSVGVIANNPLFRGGAIDVDAMAKATSFIVLCDSFNLPLILLVDQPGFLIGVEGEQRGAPGRIMNWMQALQLASVPRITITMRKNYGQAFLNMGGGRNSDVSAAWPTADFGFMDPATAVSVLHGDKVKEEPERFQELVSEISKESAPWPLAGLYESHSVIDPRETREFIKDALRICSDGPRNGVGLHRLSTWPTSY